MKAGSQCRRLVVGELTLDGRSQKPVEELIWDGKSYKAVDLGGQMGGRHIAVARRARNRKMEGRWGEDTRMDRIQGDFLGPQAVHPH